MSPTLNSIPKCCWLKGFKIENLFCNELFESSFPYFFATIFRLFIIISMQTNTRISIDTSKIERIIPEILDI